MQLTQLRLPLAVMLLLATTSCKKQRIETNETIVMPAPNITDDGEPLPPPGPGTEKRPSKWDTGAKTASNHNPNDKTSELLVKLIDSQNAIESHLAKMDERNTKFLSVVDNHSQKISKIEEELPRINKGLLEQMDATQHLDKRMRVIEDLLRNPNSPRSSLPQWPAGTPGTETAPAVTHVTPPLLPGTTPGAVKPDTTPARPQDPLVTAIGSAMEPRKGPSTTLSKFSPEALQLRKQIRDAYKKVLVDFPTSPEAADAEFGLAVMAEEEEDWIAAITHYDHLIKTFPNAPAAVEAKFNLARSQAGAGMHEAARKSYLYMADMHPRHALTIPALLGAADCQSIIHQRTNYDNPEKKAQGLRDVIGQYKTIANVYSGTGFAQTARERMADLYFNVKQFDQAVTHYKAALPGAVAANQVPLEVQLARAQIEAGQNSAARETLERLLPRIKVDPLGWEVRWNLARSYEEEEKPLDAARAFAELADEFSKSENAATAEFAQAHLPEARVRAAHSFMLAELNGTAIEQARKALELLKTAPGLVQDRHQPEVLFTLARAHRLSGDLESARMRLEELRRSYPTHDLIMRADFEDAEAMAQAGKMQDAIALLRQIILRKPQSEIAGAATQRVQELQERSGNAARGQVLYSELLNYANEADKRAMYRLRRGEALHKNARDVEATAIFKSLIADIDAPRAVAVLARYHLAVLDQKANRMKEAIAGYEKFIEDTSGGQALLGIDLTDLVDDAKYKVPKLKLIIDGSRVEKIVTPTP